MTQTFCFLPSSPVYSSYLARKGARAGLEPRRGSGALSEFLRERDSPTEGRRSLDLPSPPSTDPSSPAASSSPLRLIERLFMARKRGDGGRDEPGVAMPSSEGETGRDPGGGRGRGGPGPGRGGGGGRDPGRDWMWKPRGEPGAEGGIEGGSSCRDWVEAVETISGRVVMMGRGLGRGRRADEDLKDGGRGSDFFSGIGLTSKRVRLRVSAKGTRIRSRSGLEGKLQAGS